MSYDADWPTLGELKKIIDVDPNSHEFDLTIERQLEAGIALVKAETGAWDDVIDMPDEQLAGAALRAAYLLSLRESPAQILRDKVFETYMHGKRRRFSFA